MADLGNIGNVLTTFSLDDSDTIRIGNPQIGPPPWLSLGIPFDSFTYQGTALRTGVTGSEGYVYFAINAPTRFVDVSFGQGTTPAIPVTTVTWG